MLLLPKQCTLFEDQKIPDMDISNPPKMKTSLEMKILYQWEQRHVFMKILIFVLSIKHLFKVSIGTRRCEKKCSELTKRHQNDVWRHYLLWAYFSPFSSVCIVVFKHLNVCWDRPSMEKWLDIFACFILCSF